MTTNPYLEIDRLIVGDIYTSGEILDNLTTLCDEFGSRFGGTAGEEQAVAFMQRKLAAYGLQNVRAEPVQYIGWRRGEVSLAITGPVTRPLPCITLPHSPPAELTAAVIDLGDGAPADFDARAEEIRGKIVLVTSANPPSVKRWVHRMEKYGRAVLAGATGFIFVNHYAGFGPATGGIGPEAGGAGWIPAVSLSLEDGAYLRRLIKQQDEVRVHIHSTDVVEPMTSWNVVAELPGSDPDAQIVMLGCHYDGHDISQGALDPASGTVAVLEAARVLAAYAPRAPHTLRFALWGIEEIGLFGSIRYVTAHADELDRIRFYLNMDMAGAVNPKDIVLNEWPELARPFAAWSREMTLPYEVGQSLSAHSDHYPFMLAGVPTGAIGSVKQDLSGRGYGHTMFDTLDKAELRSLREAAVLAARLALRIARAEDWPASRRAPALVREKMQSDPGFVAERALFERVDAFYKASRSG